MQRPRLIQTYLPDGTLEGVRKIKLSESSVLAFVVSRIKLDAIKDQPELKQPSLYLLINSDENQVYIGESENGFKRIRSHVQSKDFWNIAVAIVSSTNDLEKSHIKYLESLAIEKARATAAMEVLNKTVPIRNTVDEFKIHSLQIILDDVALIAESLGHSVFASKQDDMAETWFCATKKTNAKAQFRGDKFVILAGSIIDKSYAPSWGKDWPQSLAERKELFGKHGIEKPDVIELTENITFKSPNHAGGFATGRSVNAWTAWKNRDGQTMDEVMRKGTA